MNFRSDPPSSDPVAAKADAAQSQSEASSPASRPEVQRRSGWDWGRILWRFSRPHTIIGTSLSVWGVLALTWGPDLAIAPLSLLGRGLAAWLACLCGNVYIVGLNQLEDIAIDRINKPHLPLAAGTLTRSQGRWIVGLMGGLALALAASQGVWLLATVGASLAIGTAYSLPPLRLKRFPFWASVCILAVRGGIVNLGLFQHYQDVLGQSGGVPGRIWALTAFIIVFSIAIAIFKDIPDLEGDRRYRIQTFAVRLGQRRVFHLALGILTACYLGMMVATMGLPTLNPVIMLGGHGLALALCWGYGRRVDLTPAPGTDAAAPRIEADGRSRLTYPQFYQFIWKLFFLEYLMVPIAHLWG